MALQTYQPRSKTSALEITITFIVMKLESIKQLISKKIFWHDTRIN